VEVGAAQPRDLRVDVGVDPPSQQRIVAEVDARHHMSRAEGHLLGLGEEVVGIAIEDEPADRHQRHQFLGNDFGGVEHIEAELLGLLLGEDLQAQFPLGVLTGFDGLPQVASVEIGVGAADLHGLVPHQRVGAQRGPPMELDEHRFTVCIDEPESVHAEALQACTFGGQASCSTSTSVMS
jgi:hypothetical protein